MWLSTRRLTSWTELLQAEQEELRSHSQELQATLEEVQRKIRICQAEYRDLKAEQLPKEILFTKLTMQCEVRPGAGGPQDTGLEPGADSLGLSQVRVGPHWHLCPKTVWECHPEAERKPEAFNSDNHLGWWGCVRKDLSPTFAFVFFNLFFLI